MTAWIILYRDCVPEMLLFFLIKKNLNTESQTHLVSHHHPDFDVQVFTPTSESDRCRSHYFLDRSPVHAIAESEAKMDDAKDSRDECGRT